MSLNTAISYSLRVVVILAAVFLAVTIGLIWLGADVQPFHADAILLISAVLAFLLWVVECFTRPDPSRRWARLIDTFLALGWLFGYLGPDCRFYERSYLVF